nr:mitotic-spindle organizing protein 2-like isoform X3 [Equus caballus]
MAAPGAGQGPGASPGLEAALQKLALRRKKVLSAEEMELYELAQAAGGAMDPDVFKILLGLLKLNVAPLAVFQMLKSMCAGQRLPSECQAPAAVSLPTLSAPETRVSSSCGPTSNSAGRTFQVPMVPLTPALSILLNVFLMLHLSYLNWLRSSVWLLIGLVVYFGYGIWHSKENQQELPGLTATRGSLEETVQALQPLSQAPAHEPGHMEQPVSL